MTSPALPASAADPADSLPAVRKIPKEARRRRYKPDPRLPWALRCLARLRGDTQFLRLAVQLAFIALCLWIGVEFSLFMQWGLSGGTAPFVERPPGAEAFLPISALMGLLHGLHSGALNMVHPAGTVILVAIIGVSVLLKKSFCSWMCPVGTLSEWLARLGRRLFKKNVVLWKWLDYPLRTLKYLLLFFFVYSFAAMGVRALGMFIDGSYNRVADIKMYLFFAHITPLALATFGALMLASVVVEKFWCRYLCPYGALLGLAGFLAPWRVTRVKASCIDCELCTRACPSRIPIHVVGQRRSAAPVGQVWSDECTSCMQCIEACPVKDTLVLRTRRWPRALQGRTMAVLIVGFFVAVTGLGMLTGYWQNNITKMEYLFHFGQLETAPRMGAAAR